MLRTPYSVRTKPHSAGLQISGVREEFARHRGLGAALLASLAPARLWTNRNCSFQLNKKGQRRCPIGGWGTIQGPRAACAGSWPSNHAEAAQFFPEQAARGCSCRAAERAPAVASPAGGPGLDAGTGDSAYGANFVLWSQLPLLSGTGADEIQGGGCFAEMNQCRVTTGGDLRFVTLLAARRLPLAACRLPGTKLCNSFARCLWICRFADMICELLCSAWFVSKTAIHMQMSRCARMCTRRLHRGAAFSSGSMVTTWCRRQESKLLLHTQQCSRYSSLVCGELHDTRHQGTCSSKGIHQSITDFLCAIPVRGLCQLHASAAHCPGTPSLSHQLDR